VARSFAIGLAGYAASAAVFLIFSVYFVRSYGTEAYGTFSLLLNTVSALTMFGNYHGALVAYSVAVDRAAFRAMLWPVMLYAVGAAIVCAFALAVVGSLRSPLLLAATAIAFVFIVASGLPTSALLASPANWLVNVARAVYQSLLILAFWALFALQTEAGAAFVWSLLAASAIYLLLIAGCVEFPAAHPPVEAPPRGILMLAMCWNFAHMAVMLTDKFAIRFLNVGENFADAGVFLLYLDIAGRFSAIFVIGLPALTYEMLRRMRAREDVRRPASIALALCLLVGVAVAVVGYFVIPPLYATSLAGREALPAIMGIYLVLMGLGSLFLAYCNSAGRPRQLLWHYIGIFLTGSLTLALFYVAGGGRISITQLAIALAIGQCYVLVSGSLLLFGGKGQSAGAAAKPSLGAAARVPGSARAAAE
jgi:hypothetical protein